jgi:hypothetical protein
LNFTKMRLPEAPDEARAALRDVLSRHRIQAGLLRVRDKYGDHGFCGLYVLRSPRQGGRVLLHFAFSCRILGMGVETWLYNRLGRPQLKVSGEVVSEVVGDRRDIDWIAIEGAGFTSPSRAGKPAFAYVLARGGCDMRALSHYFGMVADRVIEEFDTVRDGQIVLANHSLIAVQAMQGMEVAAVQDFAKLGFLAGDFETVLAGARPPGPAIWLLSFTIECGTPVFRHIETGALMPVFPKGMGNGGDLAVLMRGAQLGTVDKAVAAHLRERFDFVGTVSDASLRDHLRIVFGSAGDGVQVFVLLANVRAVKMARVAEAMRTQNAAIIDVAGGFSNVHVLDPGDFMSQAEIAGLESPHHFDRMVYYRMFRQIMEVGEGAIVAG